LYRRAYGRIENTLINLLLTINITDSIITLKSLSKSFILKKAIQVLNLISVLVAIYVAYYVNAKMDGSSMKDISDKYDNLLTPAGYAFGIWGLIYLSLIAFSIFQLLDVFKKDINTEFVDKIGGWFIVANLASAAWVISFTNDQIGISMVIMCIIFLSLLKIVINLNMEKWDAPFSIIALIWWPFSLYFGWITVALVANASAYLTYLGWSGSPLTPALWAYIILLIATVIFILMIWKRNMREYATVGIWGIVAIGINNLEKNESIAYYAFVMSVIIFINTALHGYQNRAMGPIRKWRPVNK
jgi:hypothetical protein